MAEMILPLILFFAIIVIPAKSDWYKQVHERYNFPIPAGKLCYAKFDIDNPGLEPNMTSRIAEECITAHEIIIQASEVVSCKHLKKIMRTLEDPPYNNCTWYCRAMTEGPCREKVCSEVYRHSWWAWASQKLGFTAMCGFDQNIENGKRIDHCVYSYMRDVCGDSCELAVSNCHSSAPMNDLERDVANSRARSKKGGK